MAELILVDINEASRILSMSKSFLYKASERGEIPRVKIGSRTLFRIPDLKLWADAHLCETCISGSDEPGNEMPLAA